jgi:hypothetical protein
MIEIKMIGILPNLRKEMEIDGRRHTTTMDHEDVYAELGIGKRLPDAGHPGMWISNVFVWVVPKIPGVAQDGARTRCRCPDCGKEMVTGRLAQHRKIHR